MIKKQSWYIVLMLNLLVGCGSFKDVPIVFDTYTPPSVKVREIPAYHSVKTGETLYSIAWIYGQDFRQIAVWNRIEEPYIIRPGQLLRLKPADAHSKIASKKTIPENRAPVMLKPTKAVPQVATSSSIPSTQWHWPVQGTVVRSFSTEVDKKKGITIKGELGQIVVAAAAGQVVYSGQGLLGYGNLVIIKHDEHYLSAYAYNSVLMVKEGDEVTQGQAIARMGLGEQHVPLLYFEIRYQGEALDPVKLLPRSHD